MTWDFSVIQQKHALTCSGLYRLIFQSLCDTSLISLRWQLDETVNFRNFCKLFTNKRNEVAGHAHEAVDEEFHPVKSGACGCKVKKSLEPKSLLFS